MKHYQRLLLPVFLALIVWGVGMGYCAGYGACKDAVHDVVGILPLYSLIVFGCYALGRIGAGIYTFKDCTEEAKSLE
ncbi:unnamed protein product, partial [Choristocarpus tenellus]